MVISIHALVKRATTDTITNSLLKLISIHALVKRATNRFLLLSVLYHNFNPRPREEGDLKKPQMTMRAITFQSTPS